MADFCLAPEQVEKFKKGLISGDIDPTKLAEMTSGERRNFFEKRFGEGVAPEMNRLLESKLLLKNQQQGMMTWARKYLAGNKPAMRDAVSRIQRMDSLLKPKEEAAFLEDLAAHRLGTRVTYDEAQQIAKLSDKITDAKTAMEAGGDRMAYGRAVMGLRNYVGDLTKQAEKLTLEDAKNNPLGVAGKAISAVAGNAKALKASMDNSAIFRQGWKTLWTHPGIWQKNARQSFVDLVKAFGSDQVMNEVNADIVSRPTYQKMQQAKLSVGDAEEAFPTSLPEKIPGVGRVYRATEHAYNAFVRRTRADVFDKYLEIAERSGVDINSREELQSIGKLVNSLTGRANLGSLEPIANVVNNVFFSPRMLKSHVDTLTAHATDKLTPFARKQAAINLLKIVGGSAAILAIAKAVNPNSVETDPRSSDFGKIKIGHTRFDMSGGMASLATLIGREATQSSKSATTGKVSPLNSDAFGAQTGTDVLLNFFSNKFSPAASVVRDLVRNQTFEGDKPTLANEAKNLLLPLPVKTFQELKDDPKAAPLLVGMIADALGIAANTQKQKLGGMEGHISQRVIDELDSIGVPINNAKRGEAKPPDAKHSKGVPEETEKQYAERIKREGVAIDKAVKVAMKSGSYVKGDKEKRSELLRKAITSARQKTK